MIETSIHYPNVTYMCLIDSLFRTFETQLKQVAYISIYVSTYWLRNRNDVSWLYFFYQENYVVNSHVIMVVIAHTRNMIHPMLRVNALTSILDETVVS